MIGERMAWRRAGLLALMALLTAGLLALATAAIGSGGWTLPGALLLACFALNAPWLALAAATGLIGFVLRLACRDPALAVLPQLAAAHGPIGLRTAIGLCLRNEDPTPGIAQLRRLGQAIEAQGLCDRFVLCLLSDTDLPAVAAREATAAARLRADTAVPVLYRRRAENAGWKAGNVMSFLDAFHAGADACDAEAAGPEGGAPGLDRAPTSPGFALFLCLDADSAMSLPAILRLVRLMQADERLGIAQATFACLDAAAAGSGTPALDGTMPRRATTRFARSLALGSRAGMRVWATGQAWWQGDQGPYWGHNAVLRVAAFRAHCRLGKLPDGSAILSHDHVEAARLHAAGWKVRVLPDDEGSEEGVPPTLPDYIGRDTRWAAGNLQYPHLLRDRSLGRIGRLQMAQAILHYALTPAWFALLPLAAWTALAAPHAASLGLVAALLAAGWATLAAPRLLGHLETLLPGRAPPGYAAAALREVLAGLLLDPILALEKTATMAALLAGRRGGWAGQAREGRALGWGAGLARFWPHTLGGLALTAAFLCASPAAGALALPATAGLLLAVPAAVLGSRPGRGAAADAQRSGTTSGEAMRRPA